MDRQSLNHNKALVSDAAKKAHYREQRIDEINERSPARPCVLMFTRGQSLTMHRLMMSAPTDSLACVAGQDNYGDIRVFVDRKSEGLPPILYKLLKAGGYELLEGESIEGNSD